VAKQGLPKGGLRGPYSGQPILSTLPPEKTYSTGLLRWDAGGPQAAFAGSKRSG
jgi:hypothetical protein